MLYVCLAILFISSFSSYLTTPAAGAGLATVSGEIICEGCNNFMGMYVELSGSARGDFTSSRVPLGTDGRFQVRGVTTGDYTVVVVDRNGSELSRDFVTVRGSGTPVAIRVTAPKKEQAAGGTVSVKQLQHKPDKAARKLFDKAAKKSKEGDSAAAIALLEEAIRIDPEFVQAMNNLAARYIVTNQFDRAVAQLDQAIEVDPQAASAHSNRSLALLNLGRLGEAEKSARRALDINSGDRRARYLLGMSLYMQKKMTDETVLSLRQSTDMFPTAQVALAAAEAATGETVRARKTILSYLESDHQSMRAEAQELLSKLSPPENGDSQ